MSSSIEHPSASDAAPASNRAARRARRKGKAAGDTPAVTHKKGQVRQSQIVAQPRMQGRRGNK